jgi:hypothetical protein
VAALFVQRGEALRASHRFDGAISAFDLAIALNRISRWPISAGARRMMKEATSNRPLPTTECSLISRPQRTSSYRSNN